MKKNRDLIWGVGFMAFLAVGLMVLGSLGSGKGMGTGSLAAVVVADEWTKGARDAKVTLVEYSDFECGACAAYYPIVQALLEEFGAKVQFVYRHFPLRQIHASAEYAARASEAAGKQGKFWEMHDLLFEKQSEWSAVYSGTTIFEEYASVLGLDVARFANDMTSKEVGDKVERDYASGLKSGVNSTPTFFLNGKKIATPRSYAEFESIIKQALDENI